jgi:predicted amidohydrolase
MTTVHISTATFQAGRVETFADFAEHVTRLVREATVDEADFLIFPEIVTAELMSFFSETDLPARVKRLADYTDDYLQLFDGLARQHGLYIVGGSHVRKLDDRLFNVAHLFSPEGEVFEQQKLHLIPLEKALFEPGRQLSVWDTEKAKICLLTCYDIEFPETVRLATLRGAEIVLSPSATAGASGYWRIRHCAQARCIENQIFVAQSCLLGEVIPGAPFRGRSSILCPCDSALRETGVVAEGAMDQEGVVSAEVDTAWLKEVRIQGEVTPFNDRRQDVIEALYRETDASEVI